MRSTVAAIISETNLLVYRANDLYDYNLICQGQFIKQISDFNPTLVIERMMKLFVQQAGIYKSTLLFELADTDVNGRGMGDECVPEQLTGDQTRFKQVLVNLIITAMQLGRAGKDIILSTCYDYAQTILKVSITTPCCPRN